MNQNRGPISLFERAKREREDEVYSVTQALKYVQHHVRRRFSSVQISGEVSRFMSRGGHWYFSLKDQRSALPCIMFRTKNERLRFTPEEGQKLLASGTLTVYEPQARVQLEINRLEIVGVGEELARLEERKLAYQKEGLFDDDRKKSLPYLPRTLGIVTSESGAVLRDVVRVVRDRFKGVSIVLSATTVQGKKSAPHIAHALRALDNARCADVILLCRGGGSLEDLWGFNEDLVVRAIASCHTPVISGVGHQIDNTLADLVADVRAATPSQAAELAVPKRDEVAALLKRQQSNLDTHVERLMGSAYNLLQDKSVLLQSHSPERLLDKRRRELTTQKATLASLFEQLISTQKRLLVEKTHALSLAHPAQNLQRQKRELSTLNERLHELKPQPQSVRLQINAQHERLEQGAARQLERHRALLRERVVALQSHSPLSVLERGYALVQKKGALVKDATTLSAGESVTLRFAKSSAKARIENVQDEKDLRQK